MSDNSHQKSTESLWITSRFLIVLCGISIIANIILALAFFSFFPIQKVQPYYLQTQDLEDKQIYLKKDFTPTGIQAEFIQKVLIKDYVLQREQFSSSAVQTDELWGKGGFVFYVSSPQVYQQFQQSGIYNFVMNENNPKKITRIVNIGSINYLESSERFQVKGTITDYDQSGRVYPNKFEEPFEINITSEFSKEKIYLPYKDRLKNPFGFVITRYEYNRTVPY
jgi:type IV secretory pathway component VirB8